MKTPLGTKLTTVLAALSLAAIAGTALAANIDTTPSSAGQGDAVVDGFTVTNLEYDATPILDEQQVIITEVRFDIVRDGTVQGPLLPSNLDAEAFVQLRDGEARSQWAQCTLTAGAAVCPVTGGEQIEIEALSDISVVAYDTFASAAN